MSLAGVKRNGEYHRDGHYSGGYAYRVCLERRLRNNRRDLGKAVVGNYSDETNEYNGEENPPWEYKIIEK